MYEFICLSLLTEIGWVCFGHMHVTMCFRSKYYICLGPLSVISNEDL